MTTNFATSCILNWMTTDRAWLLDWQRKSKRLPADQLTVALEQEFHDNLPEPDISLLESILHEPAGRLERRCPANHRNRTRPVPNPNERPTFYLFDSTWLIATTAAGAAWAEYRRRTGSLLNDLDAGVLARSSSGIAGAAGDFSWDHWETWAIEDGVPEELAQLGRSLIREAYQHN